MTPVVVVGAGVAGLVAATRMRAAGLDVIVLEARDRVGGRTVNREIPGGNQVIEMGGQWIGPTQHRALKLIAELDLSLYATHDDGLHTAEFGGKIGRYTGRIPWMLGVRGLVDIALAQLKLDGAAKRVVTDAPWRTRDADRHDSETFAAWLDRNVRTDVGRRFFRLVTEAVFSAEPEDMSALWAMFYLGAAGGLDPLINTRKGAQQDRVVGGTQLISVRLAEHLGEAVHLGEPVTAIDWSAGSDAQVTTPKATYHARRVVLAVPPPLAAKIAMTPELPETRRSLVDGLPMGAVIKVNVVYATPWWRELGYSGQANSDVRALNTVYDNTPHGGGVGVLLGFFEGEHAKRAAALTVEERRRLVLDELAAYFGPRAHEALHVMELDWCAEEYSGGCYGAFARPGVLTRHGTALREVIGPIHFAGTETATRWAGYIDGAAESGERVATEVISEIGAALR